MMKDSVLLLAIGAAALLLLRRGSVSGVGKVRRNIFAEIEELQTAGVTLGGKWEYLSAAEQSAVERAVRYFGYKQPASARNRGESAAESMYKSLSRQYLKLVNPAIGRINYPHTTSQIRNSRGDVVLTYNDYDPDRDLGEALSWFDESFCEPSGSHPYHETVYAIAAGNKFIWKGKRKGGVLLTRGLADELFASKTDLSGERRLYKGLIDNKDGWTIDTFVERVLADAPDAKSEALSALRDFPSPKLAKEYILEQYYKTFEEPDAPAYEEVTDMPF